MATAASAGDQHGNDAKHQPDCARHILGDLLRLQSEVISRGLLAARDQLLEETRRALSAQLRFPAADADSLIGEVVSGADVTLSTLFRSAPA